MALTPIGFRTSAPGYGGPIDQRLPNFIRAEAFKRVFSLGREDRPSWWYPTWSLVVGLLLGAVLSRFGNVGGGPLSFLTYNGGAEAARSFVTLAATVLATVTTLTLSLTVISLQLASSQYSPRLIEHYLNDRGNHALFSLFLGTFAFSVSTLLNIRLPSDDGSVGRVPSIAIAVLVALLVSCLGGLVVFVYRVTSSMRVESILQRVRDRTLEGTQRRSDRRATGHPGEPPSQPVDATPIRSRRSGYFAALDWEAIDGFQPEQRCDVWIVAVPGEFVIEGTPVAVVDGPVDDDLADEIESWLRFDQERWIERDVAYGIRSLVDVALKALSPGVNDPTTATMAIARVGETMAHAGREHQDRTLVTERGVRVVVATRPWESTLQHAVRQIVEYGTRDVEVVIALVQMLTGLAWAETDVDRRPAIERTATMLRRWIGRAEDRDESDSARIDAEFGRLERALRREVEVGRESPAGP